MPRRPFNGPVVITQEYGERNSFYRKGYHTGVDYALPDGYPLQSPTSGTVLEVGYESSRTNGRGYFIIIRGHDGVTHHIYHMNQRSTATTGVSIVEGAPIGAVGSTGASSGPHLHWETRRNDVDFAPGSWLFASQPVYVPPAPKEYIRIFGDYRTLYHAPSGSRKAVLAPNIWPGGHLDYEVLARNGVYVQIRTSFFGTGWLYCGSDVSHLTQFYRK